MKAAFLSAIFCIAGIAAPVAAQAVAQSYQLNIPKQPLDAALKDLAEQTGLQIGRLPDKRGSAPVVGPISGEMSVERALHTLLAPTKFTYKVVNDSTIAVLAVDTPPSAAITSAQNIDTANPNPGTSSDQKEGKVNSSRDFRMAQVDQAPPGAQLAKRQDATVQNGQLEEVVVTAQKREERLQDVPIPVTAINGEALADSNQVRLQDYFTSVPGLSVAPNIQSQQLITIRGITTGISNPTVGITIDGVPFGSSTNNGGGSSVPDIDPSDLDRIEVLRGPQGTLYGASSMGGLLNFVTLDPSTDRVSGRLQAGTDTIQNANDLGYSFRGSVNVPISDSLAVRASGFARQDPGYIDNPVTGIDGVNKVHAEGGLLTARWKAADDVALKVSALYQRTSSDGLNDVVIQPGLKDLQQDYPPGVGAYQKEIQAYDATLTAKLGPVNLTAVSGYSVYEFSDSFDFSSVFGGSVEPVYGVSAAPEFDNNKTKKFSQELRLDSSIGERVDWLLGAFYTHEDSAYQQSLLAMNATSGAVVANAYTSSFPTTYAEIAGFADLTIHITNRFDIQIGGRESQSKETYTSTTVSPLFFGNDVPVLQPELATKGNAFTYLFTPRLKLTSDAMLYARLASGYRAGGPNIIPPTTPAPAQYSPDKTDNYEVGIKADFLDHRLSVDSSIYYIDWKDLQINLLDPQGGGYISNGGHARSDGIEISVQAKPINNLSIATWVALNDAVLTESFPAASSLVGGVYAVSGDRLPYSSRFSGNLSLDQRFPIRDELALTLGGNISYTGDRLGIFQPLTAGSPTPRQQYPGFARMDLRAVLAAGSWKGTLYANNVANKRAALIGGIDYVPPNAYQYIQPRTVGLSVAKEF